MNPKASLAAFIGLALWGANAYRYNKTTPLLSSGGSFNVSQWKNMGLMLGGVVIATFIANASDSAANLVLVAFVVLWVLFLIHATAKTGTNSPASTSSSAAKPKPATAPKGVLS